MEDCDDANSSSSSNNNNNNNNNNNDGGASQTSHGAASASASASSAILRSLTRCFDAGGKAMEEDVEENVENQNDVVAVRNKDAAIDKVRRRIAGTTCRRSKS